MNCAYHTETKAFVNCNGCGKPLCRACDHRIKGFPFCQDCIVTGIELLQQRQQAGGAFIAKRNLSPFVSSVLSLICPGLGSAYNGQMLKALVYFSIFVSFFQLAIATSSPIFVFGFLGMWIFSAIDSWRTAKMIRMGLESRSAGDWLVSYFQGNPKIWGVVLMILGSTLLFQFVFPLKIPGKLVLPLVLIALGIYILTGQIKSKKTAVNQTFESKTSFRTGEFEIRNFD